jgi:NAD+ synthase
MNSEQVTSDIVNWLRDYIEETGTKGFVIGVSGGKDSAVTAGLLCRAVGKNKVFGVLMPNGDQKDIGDSISICEFFGIEYKIVNIKEAYDAILKVTEVKKKETLTNIPARLRMTVLYAFAQELDYRVCGTGNASEKYIGYCTKWGDTACDINLLASLHTDEVMSIGDYLELPHEIAHKTPEDGLSGKTDEDNIGFSYEVLNNYIRTGDCPDPDIKAKIDKMHSCGRHKFEPIETFTKQN